MFTSMRVVQQGPLHCYHTRTAISYTIAGILWTFDGWNTWLQYIYTHVVCYIRYGVDFSQVALSLVGDVVHLEQGAHVVASWGSEAEEKISEKYLAFVYKAYINW